MGIYKGKEEESVTVMRESRVLLREREAPCGSDYPYRLERHHTNGDGDFVEP